MPRIDLSHRQIDLKVVYYGPGLAGKTATLRYLRQRLAPAAPPVLSTWDLLGDRTLPCECLSFSFEVLRSWRIRMHLYTVPGRKRFNAARKFLLRGVDAVVFVADSFVRQRRQNIDMLANLQENLAYYSITLLDIPLVFQFHKRDLAAHEQLVMPLAAMREDLELKSEVGIYPTSAITGEGIRESLKHLAQQTLHPLFAKLGDPPPAALPPLRTAPRYTP